MSSGIKRKVSFNNIFILKTFHNSVFFFIVEGVHFFLALFHAIQWGLSDIDVAVDEKIFHLPVKQREQESPYVGAINIRIRHDDDLLVANL